MAITATVVVSDATIALGQTITATVTVANSGGADVTVTGFQPTATPAGLKSQAVAVALGMPAFGGVFNATVAAGGDADFSFNVTPNAPSTDVGFAMPAQQVYDIGATIYTNDGSITAATTTTLTVDAPTLA